MDDDRPEASVPDAVKRELQAKVVALVERRGLVVGVVVYAVVLVGGAGAASASYIPTVWARESAERKLVEETLQLVLLVPLFAGGVVVTTAAIGIAMSYSALPRGVAACVVLILSGVQWLLFVLLSVFQLVRFLRRLLECWRA